MKCRNFLLTGSLLAILGFSQTSHAYLSMAESAEILPQNEFQAGLEPQFLLNRGGGANINAFFDMPYNESMSGRISIGGGAVDFNTFASLKYVPFPDVDNQPAMGFRIGFGYARDEKENIFLGQFAPMLSKKTATDIGQLIPYIAVPIQIVNTKPENYTGSNFVVGSEYTHPDLPEARFGSEIGFELNKSYSYLSVYVTIPFDRTKGLKRR